MAQTLKRVLRSPGKRQQQAKASFIKERGEGSSANNKVEHASTAVEEVRKKDAEASASQQAPEKSGKDGAQHLRKCNLKVFNKEKSEKQK